MSHAARRRPAPAAADPRAAAFCIPDGPEVFSGIVHGNQIWTPDPFDVESIHAEAREAFARLLDRASVGRAPAARQDACCCSARPAAARRT